MQLHTDCHLQRVISVVPHRTPRVFQAPRTAQQRECVYAHARVGDGVSTISPNSIPSPNMTSAENTAPILNSTWYSLVHHFWATYVTVFFFWERLRTVMPLGRSGTTVGILYCVVTVDYTLDFVFCKALAQVVHQDPNNRPCLFVPTTHVCCLCFADGRRVLYEVEHTDDDQQCTLRDGKRRSTMERRPLADSEMTRVLYHSAGGRGGLSRTTTCCNRSPT